MKIDFTKQLTGLDGTPLHAGDPSGPIVTLESAATTGLFAPLPEGKGNPQQAADAFKLALRISNAVKDGAPCEITAAESTLIKDGIGRAFAYQPAVCGPVELLLEGGAIVKED